MLVLKIEEEGLGGGVNVFHNVVTTWKIALDILLDPIPPCCSITICEILALGSARESDLDFDYIFGESSDEDNDFEGF